MSDETGGGVRTALVWANDKDELSKRISTILGEFAATPGDVLHVGYAAVQVGWEDVPLGGSPAGAYRREIQLE